MAANFSAKSLQAARDRARRLFTSLGKKAGEVKPRKDLGEKSVLWSLDGKTPKRKIIKKGSLTLRRWFANGPRSRLYTATRDRVSIKKLKQSNQNPNLIISETVTTEGAGRKVKVRYWQHRILRMEPQKKFCDSVVKATCNCVTGDTFVHTAEGIRQVKELASDKPNPKLSVDYLVNGKILAGTRFWPTGEREVFELTTHNGYAVKATAEHLILVEEIHKSFPAMAGRNNYLGSVTYVRDAWKRMDQLKPGDKVVLNCSQSPRTRIKRAELKTARRLGYLFGLIVGDGSFFTDGRPDLRLYSDKGEIFKHIKKSPHIADATPIQNDNGTQGLRVKFTRSMSEALTNYGIQRGFKTLTKKIMREPAVMAGFLAGLYDTDGSLSKDGFTCCIYNTNKELLYRTQLALSYFGIVSKLRLYRAATSLAVANSKKMSETKPLYMLDITGEYCDSFFKLINSVHPNRKPSKKFKRNPMPRRTSEVVAVKSVGVETVYDCTVPDGNAFSANGIIVHNCPDWMFTFEYVAVANGNSQMIHGNGEPPEQRNPGEYQGLCKHLLTVFKYLIDRKI